MQRLHRMWFRVLTALSAWSALPAKYTRGDKRSSSSAPSDDERFEHFRHISKKTNHVESPNTASQPFSGFFHDDEFNYFGVRKKT
uniref:Uncharacterized protein n=1 Tax=Amphimedon queenslandica TaxID=400682 RepID=A0A1X7SZ81_AMPQE